MKAVMMSIKPKWVEKIINGEKTIEVRKTRPKLETPFKVYIYCTKGKDLLREVSCWVANTDKRFTKYEIINQKYCTNEIANGKVVAELTCDKIENFSEYEWKHKDNHFYTILGLACIHTSDLDKYLHLKNGETKPVYSWHIADLKIYDAPKELTEFKNVQNIRGYHKQGETSIQALMNGSRAIVKTLTIPPRSWYYVEEL